jgi:hypothetical protein
VTNEPKILPLEDVGLARYLIGYRRAPDVDAVIDRSMMHEEHCSRCSHAIWIGNEYPRGPQRLCIECAAIVSQELGDTAQITANNPTTLKRGLRLLDKATRGSRR